MQWYIICIDDDIIGFDVFFVFQDFCYICDSFISGGELVVVEVVYVLNEVKGGEYVYVVGEDVDIGFWLVV